MSSTTISLRSLEPQLSGQEAGLGTIRQVVSQAGSDSGLQHRCDNPTYAERLDTVPRHGSEAGSQGEVTPSTREVSMDYAAPKGILKSLKSSIGSLLVSPRRDQCSTQPQPPWGAATGGRSSPLTSVDTPPPRMAGSTGGGSLSGACVVVHGRSSGCGCWGAGYSAGVHGKGCS